MKPEDFIKQYLNYLTTDRNISSIHARPIAYNSLQYSNKNVSSNYLLSCWEDLGTEELCANIGLYLINVGQKSIKDDIENFKKDVSYLTDFLHHCFYSYKEIPYIEFNDEIDGILSEIDETESIYAKIIKIEPSMSMIINHARNVEPAKNREIKSLVIAAKDGNEYSKKRLLDIYLKSILKQTLYFSERYELSFEDCFQNACIGFLIAVDKYEFLSGYSFGNYYGLWVKQQILRNISEMWKYKKAPVHVLDVALLIYEYCKYNCICVDNLYCMSDVIFVEMAEALAVPFEKCKMYSQLFYLDESYEEIVNNEDGVNYLFDKDVEHNHEMFLERKVELSLLEEQLKEILETITQREKNVLQLRFGLIGGHPHTLEEVGELAGVTRERIRQIEVKALRKLRHPSRSKKIKDYLD